MQEIYCVFSATCKVENLEKLTYNFSTQSAHFVYVCAADYLQEENSLEKLNVDT